MGVRSFSSEQLHAAMRRKPLGVMAKNDSKQKIVALASSRLRKKSFLAFYNLPARF